MHIIVFVMFMLLLILYVFLSLLYLLCNYLWKMEMGEISGISMTATFREIDRCGYLMANKVFIQVNRPCTNWLQCVFLSHKLDPIIASRQVFPPTATILLGRFQPGHECDPAQVLGEATCEAHLVSRFNNNYPVLTYPICQ